MAKVYSNYKLKIDREKIELNKLKDFIIFKHIINWNEVYLCKLIYIIRDKENKVLQKSFVIFGKVGIHFNLDRNIIDSKVPISDSKMFENLEVVNWECRRIEKKYEEIESLEEDIAYCEINLWTIEVKLRGDNDNYKLENGLQLEYGIIPYRMISV